MEFVEGSEFVATTNVEGFVVDLCKDARLGPWATRACLQRGCTLLQVCTRLHIVAGIYVKYVGAWPCQKRPGMLFTGTSSMYRCFSAALMQLLAASLD